MADNESSNELSRFLDTGIYRLQGSNAVFMDPVRVLNGSYTRFRVSPSAYYRRFSNASEEKGDVRFVLKLEKGNETKILTCSMKEKDRQRGVTSFSFYDGSFFINSLVQEARPFLLRAHEGFQGAIDLLECLCRLKNFGCFAAQDGGLSNVGKDTEPSFIDLGRIWQAPLYEMSLFSHVQNELSGNKGCFLTLKFDGFRDLKCTFNGGNDTNAVSGCSPLVLQRIVVPIFNNLVMNETNDDMEAEFLNSRYILPRKSCFRMSDFGQIHDLIPAHLDHRFNLIVIDPPWENKNVHQKSVYPTLPNWHLFSLPIKQLSHSEGALVALWVTNREKLRVFVTEELFPAWGVTSVARFYWLKVKGDGSLFSKLDLFHHRPYECLLLGYIDKEGINVEAQPRSRSLQDNQVIISIPGDHSRKPPIGQLLEDHIPGPRPARCLELFARELMAGWTSWGNEPLRFQNSYYFSTKTAD